AAGLAVSVTRGDFVARSSAVAFSGWSFAAGAAFATTAVPEEGSCPDCLGVVNDLFSDCPASPTCVSSQDDRPYPFAEPWTFDGTQEASKQKLLTYLELMPGTKAPTDRYLRFEFTEWLTGAIDDAEWYFTPNDSTIQFRSARRGAITDFGQNRRRLEGIRIALGFDKVPVLRNRKRALFFGESVFDTFGESGYRDEMDLGAVYGDLDPLAPVFETPSARVR
ncbi:unnamed protein product, partial [Phaeothamnion confervicola]